MPINNVPIAIEFKGKTTADRADSPLGWSLGLKDERIAIDGFGASKYHVAIKHIGESLKPDKNYAPIRIKHKKGDAAFIEEVILISKKSFSRRFGLPVEALTHFQTIAPHLDAAKLIQTAIFVKEFLKKNPKFTGKLSRRDHPELIRNVIISNGRPFLHLNHKNQKDPVLGTGAGGKNIHYCVDLTDGNPYAMISQTSDEIQRESSLLSQVRGLDHVIQCHHSVTAKSQKQKGLRKTYLVEPLYDQGTLQGFLEKGVPENQKLRIAKQIAAGLFGVHNRGILHRDLGSQNIFLLKNEKGELEPYVGDFGTSCRLENDEGRDWLDGGGHGMAPEVARLHKQKRRATTAEAHSVHKTPLDIYSLGCLFHELFIGPLPWSSLEAQAAITTIAALKEDWMKQPLRNEADFAIQNLIWQMVRFNPNDRINQAGIEKTLNAPQRALNSPVVA